MTSWLRNRAANKTAPKPEGGSSETPGTIDQFRPPEDTLGLHVLYEPTEGPILADVVAVHGLGGDSFSTWTFSGGKSQEKSLWLKDFLPKEKYFSQTRIMTFGYDARAWLTTKDSSSSKRTFVFAGDLLVWLQNKRILTESLGRPIILIGHSLGGIVIKKAIVTAHESRSETSPLGGLYWDIYQSAKAFIFFGTPHQGSDAAVWAGYLASVAKVVGISESPSAKELETWSPSLSEVAIHFSTHVCRPGVQLVTFFETLPYNGVQVVNEGSATMNYPHEIRAGLNENHRSMCKLGSTESSTYRFVVPTMQTVAQKITKSAEESIKDKIPAKDPVPATSLPATPDAEPGTKPVAGQDLQERWKLFTRHQSGLGGQ